LEVKVDINKTIIEKIDKHLSNYNCYRYDFENFLIGSLPPEERQREAVKIVGNIMTFHGKKELHRHVAELARIEVGVQELDSWIRDHVVHSVLSFALGIYINEEYLQQKLGIHVDEFQWKLAGLFHDIGYPVQISKGIIKPFTEKIEEIRNSLGIEGLGVRYKIILEGLEQLSHGKNSLELIQKRLDKWELKIDAEKEYRNTIENGHMCHGIISALTLFKVLDYMYEKYNPKRKYERILTEGGIDWNQKYFDEDIESACAAIFIHNLNESCFSEVKIDPETAPVAFLLKVSDCLQDWERPNKDNPLGLSAAQFDIEIENNKLILLTDIDEGRKNKIRRELASYVTLQNIEVR
jgi:hypothetical protein